MLDPAANLHAALLSREFSARDLLGSTFATIERLDPALNAIVQKDAASSWRAASDSDARIARGEARPLEGLPVTIKDCFEVAGMVTSAGFPALQNYIPNEDASAVARLRRAGAILLGTTIVPIFTGGFQACNSIYGTKSDPHARSIEANGKQRPHFDLMPWACLATGAGLPAAAAPAMLGADGLPRGVQIIAASFEDRTAIACAVMLETLGGGFQAPPMASP